MSTPDLYPHTMLACLTCESSCDESRCDESRCDTTLGMKALSFVSLVHQVVIGLTFALVFVLLVHQVVIPSLLCPYTLLLIHTQTHTYKRRGGGLAGKVWADRTDRTNIRTGQTGPYRPPAHGAKTAGCLSTDRPPMMRCIPHTAWHKGPWRPCSTCHDAVHPVVHIMQVVHMVQERQGGTKPR